MLKVDVTVGLHVHEKRTKTETVQQRSAIMAARTKGQKNELCFGVSDATVTRPILIVAEFSTTTIVQTVNIQKYDNI